LIERNNDGRKLSKKGLVLYNKIMTREEQLIMKQ